jgi:hypothetical protein
MKKIGLVVPAIILILGVYLLIAGLNGGETLQVFGMVTMRSKFAILLGGVGIFASLAIAFEMLRDKQAAAHASSRQ